MLPPLTDLLDVRETPADHYVKGAAHITFSELKSRLSELPSSGSPLKIANLTPAAEEAQKFLANGGREAELTTEFELVKEPQNFRLWSPNPFLNLILPTLTPGHALDFGCGAGRETVAMAAAGWKVTAVDCLPDALDRARSLASRCYVEATWIKGDTTLFCEDLLTDVTLFCSFFSFENSILTTAIACLKPGSKVAIEAFTENHFARYGKPAGDRFPKLGELTEISPQLKVIWHDANWRSNGRHTARLLAERV